MRIKKLLQIAVLLMLLSGCGLFSSGEWEDDPGNWERAFNSTPPEFVTVIHSHYWRSPHWTYEGQYFFQLKHNEKLLKHLFTVNKMEKWDKPPVKTGKELINFSTAPIWFAPKPIEKYDIYTYQDEPRGNFLMFVDTENKDVFITDYQI